MIAYFKKEYDNFILSLGKKEATGNTNVEKLIKILEDVNIWPFLYFKKHLLNQFNEFNGYFQSNFTKVHLIIQRADSFITKIAKYFIKDELLPQIFEIDVHNVNNHKDAKDIFLGTDCENFLKNNRNIFSEEKVKEFKRDWVVFYANAIKEIKNRFYVNESLYTALSFFDKDIALFESDNYRNLIITQLQNLCRKHFHQIDVEALFHEWNNLKLAFDEEEITEIRKMKHSDIFWNEVTLRKNQNNEYMFPQFRMLIDIVLSFPNSNAEAERVFSIMNDIKSRKRNRIESDLLRALLIIKSPLRSRNETVETFVVTDSHLENLKSINLYGE